MRPLLAIAVFLLDLAAIVSILGAPGKVRRRLAWSVAVVALPVAGALLWFLRGRRRMTTVEMHHE